MGRTRWQGGLAPALPRHAADPDPASRTTERRLPDARRVLSMLPEPWVLALVLAAVVAVALADLWILRTGGSVLLALAPAAALVGMLIVLSHRQAAAYVMLASLPFAEISLGHGTSLVRYILFGTLAAWFVGVSVFDSASWLRPDRTDIMVLLWILASVASAIFLNASAAAGLAQTYANLALVYYMAARSVRSASQARGAVLALSTGIALVGLLSVAVPHVAGVAATSGGLLRQGPLGTSGSAGINRFGSWLAVGVTLPWVALDDARRPSTVIARCGSVLSLVALAATASKGAMIAVGVGFGCWVVLSPRGSRTTRAIATLASLVVAYLLLPGSVHQRFAEFLQPSSHAYSRFALWDAGLRMFLAHPIVGVGVGNFDIFAPDYFPQGTLYSQAQAAHNVLVSSLAQTGIVGTTLLLLMVGAILAEGMRLIRGDRGTARPAAPYPHPGTVSTGYARLTSGLVVGYLVFLTASLSVDLERDRYFVVLAGLVHSVYRARVHGREP